MRDEILYRGKIIKTEKYPIMLCTDFYQIAMAGVYIVEERANEEVVFEAFVRNIREKVSKNGKL